MVPTMVISLDPIYQLCPTISIGEPKKNRGYFPFSSHDTSIFLWFSHGFPMVIAIHPWAAVIPTASLEGITSKAEPYQSGGRSARRWMAGIRLKLAFFPGNAGSFGSRHPENLWNFPGKNFLDNLWLIWLVCG